jgi:hypothetical protein
MFDHILNWQLREGSHAPDGGTCVNSAYFKARLQFRLKTDQSEAHSTASPAVRGASFRSGRHLGMR